jgi:hypothetical protein
MQYQLRGGKSFSDKNMFTEVRSEQLRAPMWWRAFACLAALLPVLGLLGSLLMTDFKWPEPADSKGAFARAEAARHDGDLYGARWLYSHAARAAFWHRDWEGGLAAAGGMKRLDNARESYSMTHHLILQAMIAAESKQSRAGMAAVARAFASLGETKAATMALSRLRADWPDDVADPDKSFSECW